MHSKSLFSRPVDFQRSLEVSSRAQILIPKNLGRIQSKVSPKYTLPAHKSFIQNHAYPNAEPDAKPSESTLQSLQTVSVWLGLMHAAGAETTLKRNPPPRWAISNFKMHLYAWLVVVKQVSSSKSRLSRRSLPKFSVTMCVRGREDVTLKKKFLPPRLLNPFFQDLSFFFLV